MYEFGFGYIRLEKTVSVRLDSFSYEIINRYRGNNFSHKLRNYIRDTEREKHNN